MSPCRRKERANPRWTRKRAALFGKAPRKLWATVVQCLGANAKFACKAVVVHTPKRGTVLAKRSPRGGRGVARLRIGSRIHVSIGNFTSRAAEIDRVRRRRRRARAWLSDTGACRRSHGRHRLRRRARRLWLEPGARGRHQGAQAGAGRKGRRGRERARDRRLLEVDGIDDQPRRRRAHSGDLVRLLYAVRRRPGEEIPRRRVSPRRAAVEQGQGSQERRLLLRLSQPGAITSTASPPASRPRPTRSASSPPSRSPACSPTSIRCCSARARSIRRRRCK